mmetsp:Transcript_83851/g.233958  ORF Transcript_83851/g.233958 Transcript_83851/m.233958 type:complete len:339 (-) Transcript_83851:262-1278(-)
MASWSIMTTACSTRCFFSVRDLHSPQALHSAKIDGILEVSIGELVPNVSMHRTFFIFVPGNTITFSSTSSSGAASSGGGGSSPAAAASSFALSASSLAWISNFFFFLELLRGLQRILIVVRIINQRYRQIGAEARHVEVVHLVYVRNARDANRIVFQARPRRRLLSVGRGRRIHVLLGRDPQELLLHLLGGWRRLIGLQGGERDAFRGGESLLQQPLRALRCEVVLDHLDLLSIVGLVLVERPEVNGRGRGRGDLGAHFQAEHCLDLLHLVRSRCSGGGLHDSDELRPNTLLEHGFLEIEPRHELVVQVLQRRLRVFLLDPCFLLEFSGPLCLGPLLL